MEDKHIIVVLSDDSTWDGTYTFAEVTSQQYQALADGEIEIKHLPESAFINVIIKPLET